MVWDEANVFKSPQRHLSGLILRRRHVWQISVCQCGTWTPIERESSGTNGVQKSRRRSLHPKLESFSCVLFSGVSPVLITWRCTWRGTSKMASEWRALWDDSGWLSWPVGDQPRRCVLRALTGAPLCSSQWEKRWSRLLFAPYLVPPTPRCGDFAWKAFTDEAGGRTKTWRSF